MLGGKPPIPGRIPRRPGAHRATRRLRPGIGRLVILLALALLGVTGVRSAYVYWTSPGTGSGAGSAGPMSTVTATALVGGDTPSTTLVPGGTADVILRVTNPNSVPVQLYSVVGNGAATADSSHPGCTTTGVTFLAPASPLSPTVTVPASSTRLVHLPNAASMDVSSLSLCQGARFSLPVTVTARQ
jgi:hypothetical protein